MALFYVASASQVAPAVVRVTFSSPPLEADGTKTADGLNAANYLLTGPGLAIVAGCSEVPGDPWSVDLALMGIPPSGQWTVSVSNVKTADGRSLTTPTTASYTSSLGNANSVGSTGVNPGAEAEPAEATVRKFLNPALKGKGWHAAVAAVAVGEQRNRDNARAAFDQCFASTASGQYLITRGADRGVTIPATLGMSDSVLRRYVVRTTASKLVESSVIDLLDAFYGSDSVRASVTSALAEPYAVTVGDDLQLLDAERTAVSVVFAATDFYNTGAAKAIEVAAAITRAFQANGSKAYAVPDTDPKTPHTFVRWYSSARGVASSVRVTGGKAQNWLQFDKYLSGAYPGGGMPTWTITAITATGRMRFTTTTGLNPDLSQVRVGDYVNIFGTEFSASLRGSFPIVNVSFSYPSGSLSEYFEVQNPSGTPATVTQLATSSISFFRPVRKTIASSPNRAVLVSQPAPEADVVLPATSQAVSRQALSGAYGQLAPSLTTGSITTRTADGVVHFSITNHGLSTGDQVYLDGMIPVVTTPPTTSGTSANPGTSDKSAGSIVSQIFTNPQPTGRGVVLRLADGRLLMSGGYDNTTTATQNTELLTISSVAVDANIASQAAYQYAAGGAMPTGADWIDTAAVFNSSADPVMAGLVVAAGGFNQGASAQVVAATLNPNTNNWTAITSLGTARAGHTLTLLADGSVFAAGGDSSTATTCERLTSGPYTWTARASMNTGRRYHQAALVGTKVLVVGGQSLGVTPINTCELWDSVGNTWSYTGAMSWTRTKHALVALPNGEYMAVGGTGVEYSQGGTAAAVKDAEIWNPTTGRWRPAGKTAYGHDACFAVYLPTRRAVLVGGGLTETHLEYYYVDTGRWATAPCQLPFVRSFNARAVLMTTSGVDVVAITGNVVPDGKTLLYLPGADTFYQGHAAGPFQVTKVDANNFTVTTPGFSWTQFAAGATVTPMRAPASTSTGLVGPFAFDPKAGLAVTGSSSTTTAALAKGHQYKSVPVVDSTQFPDAPGWLVFDFGKPTQFGPLQYFGRLSPTDLKVDYSRPFTAAVPSGASVTLLSQRAPFQPANGTTVGSFYLTPSPIARATCEAAVKAAVGAGLTLNVKILYPGDRGLGAEGYPTANNYKLSDAVEVWASDDVDDEVEEAQNDG